MQNTHRSIYISFFEELGIQRERSHLKVQSGCHSCSYCDFLHLYLSLEAVCYFHYLILRNRPHVFFSSSVICSRPISKDFMNIIEGPLYTDEKWVQSLFREKSDFMVILKLKVSQTISITISSTTVQVSNVTLAMIS